ncbi:hypothetical protein CI1B_46340 [Bradyrhizobium ivorense]|uniref:Uncharacterized protein n=1 Tax=Bradyrhizobium ivorense TaxID=2511166 RepID=A0A508TBY4_9BRAD|nr:hypothetical protein CI1B_46340 [Bradyrhizobium ivorense]
MDKGLIGTLLRYSYEVRSEAEYFDNIQDVSVTRDMSELAKQIVNQKSGHFEPEKFEDKMKLLLSTSSTGSAPASRLPRKGGCVARMSSI